MSHQLHFWFDNAKFALKPLRQSSGEVVVQWHWLKKPVLKPKVVIRTGYDPLLQAGLIDQNWGDCLAHRKSGMPIRTGQTFTIRAENPEDLPSWDLLQLQWDLLRVAAICGAADVTDDYYDSDDDHAQDETVTARQIEIFALHGRRRVEPDEGSSKQLNLAGRLGKNDDEIHGKEKEDSPHPGNSDNHKGSGGDDDQGSSSGPSKEKSSGV
jgi:hypothetical protein